MTHPHFSTEHTSVYTEGSTYKKAFGKANLSDFKQLAFIEYNLCIAEIPILYFYRVTSDNYLQFVGLLLNYENDEETIKNTLTTKQPIVCQYKYDNDLTFTDNLLLVLTEFIHSRSMFDGEISKFKSDIISDLQFIQIKTNITSIKADNSKSELIDFLKTNNLSPKIYDSRKGLYISKCIKSDNHHLYITISPNKEEFGCGYCCKKGGLKELKQWILDK